MCKELADGVVTAVMEVCAKPEEAMAEHLNLENIITLCDFPLGGVMGGGVPLRGGRDTEC